MQKEKKLNSEKLLKDRRIVEEINRHLWIESEKAGEDITFEAAAEDWLQNFSKAWMQYHTPKGKAKMKIKQVSAKIKKVLSKKIINE